MPLTATLMGTDSTFRQHPAVLKKKRIGIQLATYGATGTTNLEAAYDSRKMLYTTPFQSSARLLPPA